MKIRQDFVTNSSSSSEKQKAAVIRYVEETFLGSPVPKEEKAFQAFLQENGLDEDYDDAVDQMREIIREGRTPWYGNVTFDEPEYNISALYQGLWEAIEEADPERFEGIDTDLSY